MMRPKDNRTNAARAIVNPIESSRTFHHGRDSGTSYAVLSADTMDVIAPELLHSAPRMPIVRRPGCSPETMLSNCFCTIDRTSGGAIGVSAATTSSTVFHGR